jgi:CRP/FNR family cyclic AMP-dependent transcriptional regulator
VTSIEPLQACALFRDFTETGLRIFAAIATERPLSAGTPLFAESTAGEALFIVKKGTVRLALKTPAGERELAVAGPGEHLGALALLGKSTRLVSAVAASDCEVVEIAHRDFARLQPQKPQACLKLALAIAADVAARAAETRDLLRELATRKPASP